MRAFAIVLAAAASLAIGVGGGSPGQAMTAKPIGLLAAMPALDLIEPVHCRRFRHAHRRGHALSRGCDSVVLRPRFDRTPAQTIQSGTRPLTSGESTRLDPLRRGPDSPTPSGVRPLSSERSGLPTGSSSSPFSSPSGGSPFSGSPGGLR